MFHLICKVTGVSLIQSPQIALLNKRLVKTPKCTQTLNLYILLGAKITIARALKHHMVSFALANRKICWIMSQKRIVSLLLNSKEKFDLIWEPWAGYMKVSL